MISFIAMRAGDMTFTTMTSAEVDARNNRPIYVMHCDDCNDVLCSKHFSVQMFDEQEVYLCGYCCDLNKTDVSPDS